MNETVICQIQDAAYKKKADLSAAYAEVLKAKANLSAKEEIFKATRKQLTDFADFLNEYNADALYEATWYENLGLENPIPTNPLA